MNGIKVLLLGLTVLFLSACKESADTIYYGGDIITIDDKNPSAEALAVKEGKILAVGSREDIMERVDDHTVLVDLAGKTLMPGFVDAHSHFSGVALQAVVANLLPAPDGPVNNIAALVKTLKEYQASAPFIVTKHEVVIGFNYDDSQLENKKHPTRKDLDLVSKTLPVLAVHQSGHLGVYNTKALQDLGLFDGTGQTIAGGTIDYDDNGVPTGLLKENAHFESFAKLIPKFSPEEAAMLYRASEDTYAANGFTTVQDGKTTQQGLDSFIYLAEYTDGFKVDLVSYADIDQLASDEVLNGPFMSRDYANGYRIGGVKLTFDGSPQGKTAWFKEPYVHPPEGEGDDYKGEATMKFKRASELYKKAYANDWQVLVHGNGDAAIEQLIRVVNDADLRGKDHRTVLVHGQFMGKDQVAKIKELNIFPALFPMHTYYWGDWHIAEIVGHDRAMNMSPTGWMRENDMKFTIHSDAPVTFPNSMRILDSAVNRLSRDGVEIGAEHKLQPLEALKAMTLWSAYQHFEENTKGSLEVGKLADLVILDQNPLTTSQAELLDIQVVQTIKEGMVIYPKKTPRGDFSVN